MSWFSKRILPFFRKISFADVAHVVDVLSPGFINELESYIGSPDARGRTVRNIIIAFCRGRNVNVSDFQIDVLIAVLTPLAKQLKLVLR